MIQTSLKLVIIFLMISMISSAQNNPSHPASPYHRLESDVVKFVWVKSETADIFPEPLKVNYEKEYFQISDKGGKMKAVIVASNKSSLKAADVFNELLSKYNYPEIPVVETSTQVLKNEALIIKLNTDDKGLSKFGDQAYSIKWKEGNQEIVEVSGSSKKGLIYGMASLSQLVLERNNEVVLRKTEVFDHPKFSRRIFNSKPVPEHIWDDLDWMVRYKIECLSFHNQNYTWNKIDEVMKANLQKYSEWKKKFGGVEALLILNLYRGPEQIEISDPGDIKKLENIIKTAYESGVSRVMINADDSPPFHFGEGYVSNSEADREKFSNFAESHCFLMNEISKWNKKNNYNLEFYYCPSFYTYQEMHYGEMNLFKDTPWEKDAYGPLKRDLKIFGEKMPNDVSIIWTGPDVCSRKITDDDLKDWTKNLQGKRPFLFDNSIFSQLKFTARTMFTAYDNDFPENFDLKTGGNGLFINGDGTGETSRVATMTANAYMWEGNTYNPTNSLMNAMIKLYGKNSINTLFKYKDTELELVKTIKQRQLWFAADELWKSIRETRFITDKNPFYYQVNYNSLKALRMQLKYSVPEPESMEEYKTKCLELDKKRRTLINEIENLSFVRLSNELQNEMIKLPEFSDK